MEAGRPMALERTGVLMLCFLWASQRAAGWKPASESGKRCRFRPPVNGVQYQPVELEVQLEVETPRKG